MASPIRITTGRRSRVPGEQVGLQVNTFGLDKLQAGLTGEAIAPILYDALQPALRDAQSEWPVLTGASLSTMVVGVTEVGPRFARAVLQVGGEALINHPDNPSRKDYAPFIEFNGSPTGKGQGAISNAIFGNDRQIREDIRNGVKALLMELLA